MASLTDSLTLLVTPKTLRRKTVAIVSVTLGAFLVVLHVFSRIVLLEWTLGPDESATLQKAKMHKGVGTQCAKVEAALEPGREVCADAVTWLPTRTEMLIPYNPLRTSLVNAEYQSAASKQLRRTLRAFEGSDLTVEVRVGEVAPNLDPDESAFLPPQELSRRIGAPTQPLLGWSKSRALIIPGPPWQTGSKVSYLCTLSWELIDRRMI